LVAGSFLAVVFAWFHYRIAVDHHVSGPLDRCDVGSTNLLACLKLIYVPSVRESSVESEFL
jgi:hypothetical protein